MKEGSLIKIIWRDAWNISQWIDESALEKPIKEGKVIETIGHFYCKDKFYLTVYQSRDNDPFRMYDGIYAIPNGCIIEIIKLKEDKP